MPPKKSSAAAAAKANTSNNNKDKKPTDTSSSTAPTVVTSSSSKRPPFNPYRESFVQDYKKSKQDTAKNDDLDDNDEIEELLHEYEPQPFIVCCVVNHIHNLRVEVDPTTPIEKRKRRGKSKRTLQRKDFNNSDNDDDCDEHQDEEDFENNSDGHDDFVEEDEEEEEEEEEENEESTHHNTNDESHGDDHHHFDNNNNNAEIAYNNDPHLWDYFSIWDCPATVLSSIRKRNLYLFHQDQIRKDKERNRLKMESEIMMVNKLSRDEYYDDFSRKKEKKSKKDKKDKKEKKDKRKKLSSLVSEKQQQQQQAPSILPSCYQSKYDQDANPILHSISSDDEDRRHLAYEATSVEPICSNDDNMMRTAAAMTANGNAGNHDDQITNTTTAKTSNSNVQFPIIEAPPSRVCYDPVRYQKIVSQTDFEVPHPALVDLASIFNGKIEIRCMLTAPTMYHAMPTNAESKAMREKEQQYFRSIPLTSEMIEKAIPTSKMPTFPSAASLRAYGRGAMKELNKILAERQQQQKQQSNKDREEIEHDAFDDPLIQRLVEREEYKGNRKTKKRKHYAGLLKLRFSGSDFVSDNSNNYNGNDNENDDGNHKHHSSSSSPQLLIPKNNSDDFTLVHCLGPVQFLPPVESAIFVTQPPKSMSFCIAEVPDRELHPMEQILLKALLEVLETDEYRGSLASSHCQNLIRDLPQFPFVIGGGHGGGGGGADGGSSSFSGNNNNDDGTNGNGGDENNNNNSTSSVFFETWIDFINAHANIEFAVFSYSSEDLKEIGLSSETQSASSLFLPHELRLVSWSYVNNFMEGDYSRWANKVENERQVIDVMTSCLSVRPYESTELIKLLGQNRSLVSLMTPCLKRMLEVVSQDSRYVILNSVLHPLTIELREDLAGGDDQNNNNNHNKKSSYYYYHSEEQKNLRRRRREEMERRDRAEAADPRVARDRRRMWDDLVRMQTHPWKDSEVLENDVDDRY